MSHEINKKLLGLQQRIEKLESMLEQKNGLDKDWLTAGQVLNILDITSRTLHNYRLKALIAYTKVGPRKFLYSRKSIERLINEKFHEQIL